MPPCKDNNLWFKFYYDFAAAYGTLWFVCMVIAVVTQSSVQTGQFGMFGFPVIALMFAFFRREYRD